MVDAMHSLTRTSPKGTPFVGTCSRSGQTGLTFQDMSKRCENVRGISNDEEVIEAVLGPVGDGRYCRHHDDDPAHGRHCYSDEAPEE